MKNNFELKKQFSQLLKKQFSLFVKTPVFIISTILFEVFVYVNYFSKLPISLPSTQSPLQLLFSSVPYICIIIIPSLCYKPNFTIYNDFLPCSRVVKLLVNFTYILISYLIMLVLLVPAIIITTGYAKIDAGQIITSFICLILFGSALISICIFIENLFTSQIISFIVSAVCLGIINSSHLFSVYVNLPSYLSSLCKQISFAWHFDAASKGIIDTRDILFLIFTSVLFLYLTNISSLLKAGKTNSRSEKTTIWLSIIFIILVILNGSNYYKRFDFSKTKVYSVSKYTKQLTSKIDKNLKITYYRSSSLVKLYPQIRDISDYLMMYSSQNKNISLQIKDPDKENLTSLLENYGIYSNQLRNIKNNSTEYLNVYSAIVLEYNGKAEVVPFILAADTLEYELDGRLLHLISGEERFVNIIVGNGLSLENDYNYVLPYLTSQGFVCNVIYLDDNTFADQLENANGSLLILGDSEISVDKAIAIEYYLLQQKGNALICTSPFTADIENDWSIHYSQKTNIVEMIENWGVTFTDLFAADISCARVTMYSQEDSGTNTKIMNYPLWVSLMPQYNCKKGATLFWPSKLTFLAPDSYNVDELQLIPYFISSEKSYTYEADRHNAVSVIETNPFTINEMNIPAGKKESLIIGAEIKGKVSGLFNEYTAENVHVIVVPDQYFVHSLMNEYIGGEYGDYRNFDVLVNMLLKLNGEEELANLQSR